MEALLAVLKSSRWAITSPHGHSSLWERRFAEAFASFTGTHFCVPVDHGSSALTIAAESLQLPYGSLVAVPALTWVASASAVMRAGLVPIVVDVSTRDGCLSVDTLNASEPPDGYAAIVAVHYASGMTDVPQIRAAWPQTPVIEDAAQAHGAEWEGRPAGSIGLLGCFSMQNQKVLTAGEGGAVVTSDASLRTRLEELRADSRSYAPDVPGPLELDLVESAGTMGHNYCMTEFQAALLCAQLESLEEQNLVRERNYEALRTQLADVAAVRMFERSASQNRLSVYETTLIFQDPIDVARVCCILRHGQASSFIAYKIPSTTIDS